MEDYYPSQVWRHCPYCGTQQIDWADVTHYMYCSSCKQMFYINPSAAVVALIEDEKGRLLFTQRANDPAKGTLDLPGGFVDLFETAEQAIRREVKEELNLDVCETSFFGSYPNRYLYGGIVYFTLDMVFACKVLDFSVIKAADDVSAYQFIAFEDINVNEIGLESIRKIIQDKYK